MAVHYHFKKPSWRVVIISFVVMVALLATSSSAVFLAMRRAQKQEERLMQNSIASVELVDRMGAAIARSRTLLSEHIYDVSPQGMASIEEQIAEAEDDYQATARQYLAFIDLPAEDGLWRSLQANVTSLAAPMNAALSLSRENRDLEARKALHGIDDRFAVIEHEVGALVAANRGGEREAVGRAEALGQWSSVVLTSVAAAQVGLTLLVGIWTTRLVRRRDEEIRRHAEMLEWRNHELDAFAGCVAHDLRGPLATITLATANLGRRLHGEEKTVAILQRAAERMNAIIGDLLALSRINEETAKQPCDPAAIAAQIQDELTERLETEQVNLSVVVESAIVRCAGAYYTRCSSTCLTTPSSTAG
jgi:signal transduction histidine kinase